MKIIFKTFIFLSVLAAFIACGACSRTQSTAQKNAQNRAGSSGALNSLESKLTEADMERLYQTLDEISEMERAGSWIPGMGLNESTIRENIGDYQGAVAAVYKELSYAYGRGLIQKQDVENGLLNLHEFNDERTTAAADAMLAFSRGQWNEALNRLSLLFYREDEPDSFVNWMMLVCSLEKNSEDGADEDRKVSSAYRSIRSRYALLPEYWYRGAKAFSGTIAADFAENCINSSPQGPYAEYCRKILAQFTGLKPEDGISIKTKREIEYFIAQSVNSGDPQILSELFPLISLPENPYTVFAVNALKSLTNMPQYREYFTEKALSSDGRLAERLSYIGRS